MVLGLTTPVRDGNRDRPLGPIDDNQRLPAIDGNAANGIVKPALDPFQTKQKEQAAADKRRKKVKPSSLCLTPPSLIQGSAGQSYQRGLCIGEGGFARCFQVNDGNGEIFAAKTLAKAALNSEKTRSKLLTEIKIHRAMNHPGIVNFVDCFEDDKNVYMLLEMCSNQSLADMVNRRRHLTEPEARFFFLQILGASAYMHSRGVVHRDLKLGNIFLDRDMNLKVGDFGLAARMDTVYSRRFTVCGTPNYISPEVLKRPHGHGFQTDIWALGVILYAMLVGRPPFQDRDVDKIYQRIKQHEPCFPPAPSSSLRTAWDLVPDDARDLVTKMLHPNPAERPSVNECLQHPWVRKGVCVSSVPAAALTEPVYLFATAQESAQNYVNLLRSTGLDKLCSKSEGSASVEIVSDAEMKNTSNKHILPHSISPPSTKDKYKPVAVAPEDSPANAQARTERIPDYDSPVVGRPKVRSTTGNNDSPVVSRQRLDAVAENAGDAAVMATSQQDARSAANSAVTAVADNGNGRQLFRNRFKFSLLAARTSTETDEKRERLGSAEGTTATARVNAVGTYGSQQGALSYAPPPGTQASSALSTTSAASSVAARPTSNGPPRLLQRPASTSTKNIIGPLRVSLRQTLKSIKTSLDTARQTKEEGILPSFMSPVEPPSVVTRWADFEDNWGLAYCFSDGSVGMLFRDRTSMRMDPSFNTYVYFESRSRPGLTTMHRTAADTADPRRAKKIEVLNYVRRYMDRELGHAIEPVRQGGDVSQGQILHHLQKNDDYIMFLLTDGSLQFNFIDHNKVILYDNGTKLGLITSNHQLFSWQLDDALVATRAKHFQRIYLTQKLVTIHNAVREYYQAIE